MTNWVIMRGESQLKIGGPLIVATDASVWLPAHVSGFLTSKGNWGIIGWNFTNSDPCFWGKGHGKCTFATELRAIFFGIEHIPDNKPLTILTDSRDAVGQILKWQKGDAALPEWYNTKRNHPWTPNLIKLKDRVQKSGSLITVKWVKGHKGHPYNSAADRLSQLGRSVLEHRLEPIRAKEEATAFMEKAFTKINNSTKATR